VREVTNQATDEMWQWGEEQETEATIAEKACFFNPVVVLLVASVPPHLN